MRKHQTQTGVAMVEAAIALIVLVVIFGGALSILNTRPFRSHDYHVVATPRLLQAEGRNIRALDPKTGGLRPLSEVGDEIRQVTQDIMSRAPKIVSTDLRLCAALIRLDRTAIGSSVSYLDADYEPAAQPASELRAGDGCDSFNATHWNEMISKSARIAQGISWGTSYMVVANFLDPADRLAIDTAYYAVTEAENELIAANPSAAPS